jgi:Rod binding domain-containing protein
MLDGITLTLKSSEIVDLLQKRAQHARDQQVKLESRFTEISQKLTAAKGLGLGDQAMARLNAPLFAQISLGDDSDDPMAPFKHAQRSLSTEAEYFDFAAKHVQPGETFRLSLDEVQWLYGMHDHLRAPMPNFGRMLARAI